MMNRVHIACIGLGGRGTGLANLVASMEDVCVAAICDVYSDRVEQAIDRIGETHNYRPEGYTDYSNVLSRDDLDGVIVATSWTTHVEISLAAMRAGLYVGSEVGGASSIQECWELVRTSEETGMPFMLLENCCYGREEMAVLNMVRKGVFGELLHCQGGYQHDLRDVKFNDGKQPYGGGLKFNDEGYSESKWRTQHSIDRNGDLYPTHGIGPIHTMLDINRGNRFVHMTSTASQSRGLNKHIIDQGGLNHRNAGIKFKLGDIVTSVIKCSNGQSIVLSHDTNSPRPYSLNFRVQGTQGIWQKDARSIYIEGVSEEEHRWDNEDQYLTEYDHPLWKRFEDQAAGSGHGGMDFFILRAFIESLKGAEPILDVYDAASMSVVSPLSEKSIRLGSASVKVPDFTRGKWKNNDPIFGTNDYI